MKIYGQCSCAEGSVPLFISHSQQVIDAPDATTIISFPKFNPELGTLTCVQMEQKASIRYNFVLTNTTSTQAETYTLRINAEAGFFFGSFATPIFLHSQIDQRLQPEYTLLPGESLHYGPDTRFINYIQTTSTSSNITRFLGAGNIDCFLFAGVSATALKGNGKYTILFDISPSFDVTLTYYYCPAGTLNNNIKNFTAVKKETNVLLQWAVDNGEAGESYDIEVSKDGQNFQKVGQKPSVQTSGVTVKYDFLYQSDNTYNGKLYFRIKVVKPNGKFLYSTIKTVNLESKAEQTLHIYPNPVKKDLTIEFDQPESGDYRVEIVSNFRCILFEHL